MPPIKGFCVRYEDSEEYREFIKELRKFPNPFNTPFNLKDIYYGICNGDVAYWVTDSSYLKKIPLLTPAEAIQLLKVTTNPLEGMTINDLSAIYTECERCIPRVKNKQSWINFKDDVETELTLKLAKVKNEHQQWKEGQK